MQISVFVQNRKKKEMEIFTFCVITFQPIISKTCQAPQNDRRNLSFVKDNHTFVKKMARKGRTKDIFKGTFICMQTLCDVIGVQDFGQAKNYKPTWTKTIIRH